MRFFFSAILFVLISLSGCNSSDPAAIPVEEVVLAYDTLELRYQQMADLAIDLMANISMDPEIKVTPVQDLLDREPVVSLDFRKLSATHRDILNFIKYQQRIDEGLKDIFKQLNNASKWRAAPLILQINKNYELLKDSITLAKRKFNTTVDDAHLQLQIPVDSAIAR